MKRLPDVVPLRTLEILASRILPEGANPAEIEVFGIREANSRVSEIARLALSGHPQFIQKESYEALVVMTISKFLEIEDSEKRRPARSFFEMIHGDESVDFDPALNIEIGRSAELRRGVNVGRLEKLNLTSD